MTICSNCDQDKDTASFGKFKMCAQCRAENTKQRQEQRAALKTEKKYHCPACDYTAGSSTLLKTHEKSQKHLHMLLVKECERLGVVAPDHKKKGPKPQSAHLRFNIVDMPDKKYYRIQWTHEGGRYSEQFSYRRRSKEEAMADALECQAELRAEC